MRDHIFISFFAVLLCWSIVSAANDKPVVFNHISHQLTELAHLVHKHFDNLYEVVDIDDQQHAYTPPKGIHGFGTPSPPVFFEGRCIRGNVLILHVITLEGLVASPHVAKSTDPLLSKFAIERMNAR